MIGSFASAPQFFTLIIIESFVSANQVFIKIHVSADRVCLEIFVTAHQIVIKIKFLFLLSLLIYPIVNILFL